jgi:circadian clock protein KaiB
MKGVQVPNDLPAGAAGKGKAEYVLRLFISGASANSAKAVLNLKNICETYIKGRYELEVIDIYQQNELAQKEHIIAVPSLIIKTARSAKRLVGTMSDCQKLLQGLMLTT